MQPLFLLRKKMMMLNSLILISIYHVTILKFFILKEYIYIRNQNWSVKSHPEQLDAGS